jgi:hypothetical protein
MIPLQLEPREIRPPWRMELFVLQFPAGSAINRPVYFPSREGRGMWPLIGLSIRQSAAGPVVPGNGNILLTLRDAKDDNLLTDFPTGFIPFNSTPDDGVAQTWSYAKPFARLKVSWDNSFFVTTNPGMLDPTLSVQLVAHYGKP